jgi:hypothetical protein
VGGASLAAIGSMARIRQQLCLVAAVLIAVAGCKSARHERKEAEAAAAKAERTGIVVLHELEHGDAKSIEHALSEHAAAVADLDEEEEEAVAAAARERASYKQLLEKEIGSIDRRVSELVRSKKTKPGDVDAARSFKALLQKDLDEIEHTGEDAWPKLKERIDHDLENERPSSVPRSFDKSYGI